MFGFFSSIANGVKGNQFLLSVKSPNFLYTNTYAAAASSVVKAVNNAVDAVKEAFTRPKILLSNSSTHSSMPTTKLAAWSFDSSKRTQSSSKLSLQSPF
jgi:hypothetical protein